MDTLQLDRPFTSKKHRDELEQTSEMTQPQDLYKDNVGSDVSLHHNVADQELVEIQRSTPFDGLGSGGHMKFPGEGNSSSDCFSCHVSEVTSEGRVLSLAITKQQLYTVSETGAISVRDPLDLSATPTCSFDSKIPDVSTLAIDGEWIVTGHRDYKIRVWHRPNISEGGRLLHTRLATLPTTKEYMKNWAWKRDYVQVRRHHNRPWMEHADKISALAVGREGLLYSASWDKTVKVWNLNTMKCEESIKAHDDAVNALVVGEEDGVLYTGSTDRTISAWRRQRLGERHKRLAALVEGQESGVNALAMAGSRLYAGGSDGSIKVWRRKSSDDVKAGWMEMLKGGHSQAVLSMDVVIGQSLLVVSGSADKSVRVWRQVEEGIHSCVAVLEGHTGPVKSVTLQQAQSERNGLCVAVYSAALDGLLKMWPLYLPPRREREKGPTANERGQRRLTD